MTKKLITIFILTFLVACQSANDELTKTAKARASSERINSSEGNSKDAFKELDQ
jgi:hypothetical protein